MSQEKLKGLIQNYNSLNLQLKSLEKDTKEAKKQLIEELESNGLNEYKDEDYKVTYKASERSSVNEEKLIALIKWLADKATTSEESKEILDAIIKVEKVDENHLENLIFAGIITPEQLEPAYESKEVWTLRVSKNRGKK